MACKVISGLGIVCAGTIISFVNMDDVKNAAQMTWQKELVLLYIPELEPNIFAGAPCPNRR